jgi:hypothetical protein
LNPTTPTVLAGSGVSLVISAWSRAVMTNSAAIITAGATV